MKAFCVRGHPMSGSNLRYRTDSLESRYCLMCLQIRNQEARNRNYPHRKRHVDYVGEQARA
jgi:hypothetical protein